MIAVKSYDSMLKTLDAWYKKQTSFGFLTPKKTKENIILQVGALYNILIERPVWISYNSVDITYDVKSLESTSSANIDMHILDLRIEDSCDVGTLTNVNLSPPPVIAIPKDIGNTFFKDRDTVTLRSTVYGYTNPKVNAISHLIAVPDILVSIVGFFDEDVVMEKYAKLCIQCANEFVVD